jgi:tRNA pseudouridine13 synthase
VNLTDCLDPPRLCGPPNVPGALRSTPEDFVVDEVPAYLPDGEGEHLYVRFEKVGLDTPEAVRRIARALGADPRDAGFAGLKDRHAVTRQWASFARVDPGRLADVELEGIRVLEHGLHRNKLRTGHLRANRFELRVRGVPAEAHGELARRLAVLGEQGVPNYFGEQRFGREASNLDAARRWLIEGGRAPREPFRKKLLVSVLQAALFNELLGQRVSAGTFDGVVPGDLLRKEDTGGLFVSADPSVDAPRAQRFEVSATGPMFGSRMRWPEGEARALEEAALARWGLSPELLERFRASGEGTRRPYRVRLQSPAIGEDAHGIVLSFTLPSGSYATVVARELFELGPSSLG